MGGANGFKFIRHWQYNFTVQIARSRSLSIALAAQAARAFRVNLKFEPLRLMSALTQTLAAAEHCQWQQPESAVEATGSAATASASGGNSAFQV